MRAAINDGADCPDLFTILDGIDEQDSAFPTAQGELINIGCYTRTSARTDGDLRSAAPDSPWLGVPGERVQVSAGCAEAAQAAADEPDVDRAEPLIAATLDACTSVSEWMSAIETYPGVMGMTEGYIPQLLDVQSACYSYPSTAVCTDATNLGLDVSS